MTKYIDILTMIAAKIMKNYEKLAKMTKTLTFLTMIAAKIMKNDKKIPKMTKNDKNIDIFEYDCSENHEIMVVLMDFRKVFGAFLGRNFGIGS